MSQNPNDPGYFTNLLNSGARPYGGSSNPSTPSSQGSNPPSPYGSQQFNPAEIYLNQQYAFQQVPRYTTPPQFYNTSQPSTFPITQSQPPTTQSQPPSGSQFKVPQPREPAKGRGKKTMAKKNKRVVDLDDDDDDDLEGFVQTGKRKWTKGEETLLAELWIGVSQDENVGNDRTEDFFWNEIWKLFNDRTVEEPRTKNMLTGKWTRMNSDCQKFNGIYKHLQRRSGENEHDHVENAKTNFEQRFGTRGFTYTHVWEILKNYPKWDAAEPLDIACVEDIFGPDKRERPVRRGKKQKSTSTSSAASSGGSQTSSYSGQLSEKYQQTKDAQIAMYDARRQKEKMAMEMQAMQMLMLDANSVADPVKADLIRRRQAKLLKKYQKLDEEEEDSE